MLTIKINQAPRNRRVFHTYVKGLRFEPVDAATSERFPIVFT